MKTIRIIAGMLLCVCLQAQTPQNTPLYQTSTAQGIDASEVLVSLTGNVVNAPSAQTPLMFLIESEAVLVIGTQQGPTTPTQPIGTIQYSMKRAQLGTTAAKHVSGSLVLSGFPSQFGTTDKSGFCNPPPQSPKFVNVTNSKIWSCVSGTWQSESAALPYDFPFTFVPFAAAPGSTVDAGITRTAADAFALGNGTPGNASAALSVGSLVCSGTPCPLSTFTADPANWPTWLTPSVTSTANSAALSVAAGTVPIANGGTGLTAAGAQLSVLRVKSNVITAQLEYAAMWGVSPLGYNFSIAPGGALTGGTAATITLPYGPLGTNGSDANHLIYLSGGVGSAEAVLITGGSCVSGTIGSCTLQFTPVNSHSAGYLVGSSGSGMQEALNAAGNVLLPVGNIAVHATITPPASAAVSGVNEGASTITFDSTSTKLFNISNDRILLQNFAIIQSGTPVSGNVGIRTFGPLANSTPGASRWGTFRNLYIVGFFNGIIGEGNGQLLNGSQIQVTNSLGDGIILNGVQGYWDAVTSQGGAANGFTLGSTTTFGGSILFASNFQTFNNAGWGISSTTVLYASGGNTYLNNDKLGELLINTPSADVGYISDANIQFAGQSIFFGTNANSPGIQILAGSGPFNITNCHFFNTQGNSILSNASNTKIFNSTIVGSGQGATMPNIYSIATSSCVQCVVSGVYSDTGMLLNGNAMVITGNTIVSASNAAFALDVSGGTDVIIANNYLKNAGSTGSLGINTGVTYMHPATNIVIGSVNNLGTPSTNSLAL